MWAQVTVALVSVAQTRPDLTANVYTATKVTIIAVAVCIPGSHKANFPCPPDVRTMEAESSYFHVAAPAGAAIIFTEALTVSALLLLCTTASMTAL